MKLFSLLVTLLAVSTSRAHNTHDVQLHRRSSQHSLGAIDASRLTINSIPYSTRAYWMRIANSALPILSSSCPFAAFATAIVNHTYPSSLENNGLGKLICIGINENSKTGNPSLHGEIAAISNCTTLLTDPNGEYNMTAAKAQAAFADLSLYTNAESCPMVFHTPSTTKGHANMCDSVHPQFAGLHLKSISTALQSIH
jgi:hypothetical protein